MQRVGAAAQPAQARRDGGGEALEQGGGQRGRDVEAGREALLEALEAGREAQGARGQAGHAGRPVHEAGEVGGLASLGLGVQLHQPRDVRPLLKH